MGQESIKQIRVQKEKPKTTHRKRNEEGEAPPPEIDTKKVQKKGKELTDKAEKMVEEIDKVLEEAKEVQEELKPSVRGKKEKSQISVNPRIPMCDGTMVDPVRILKGK